MWRPKVSSLRRSAIATAASIGLLMSGGAGLVASDVVAIGDEVTGIRAGGYHSCALKGNGTVWCWGDGTYGQLGDGTTGDPALHLSAVPRKVRQGSDDMRGVVAISAGLFHTCALKSSGAVWCWGDDTYGQLGDGTTGDASHRRLKAVRVRRGSGYLTDVSAISAGERHTCARRMDGSAWCWGDDTYGQLGDGTTGDSSHRRLKAARVRRGSGYLTDVTNVTAGSGHSCARTASGSAWCWGDDTYGQLGDDTTGNAGHVRLKAVRVRRGSGYLTEVTGVSAGKGHTCARRGDGSAWCWGYGEFGQLGDGTTGDAEHIRKKAVRVRQGSDFLADVKRLDAGKDHTCAQRSGGTAWCWGAGGDGSVGDGTTGVRLKAVRVVRATSDLTDVRDISAGAEHSCAARANRTAWCWGMDNSAQLGDGLYDGDPHPHAKRVVFR
jgi:alpha-tubulin suppressor-like RCC1 family protein